VSATIGVLAASVVASTGIVLIWYALRCADREHEAMLWSGAADKMIALGKTFAATAEAIRKPTPSMQQFAAPRYAAHGAQRVDSVYRSQIPPRFSHLGDSDVADAAYLEQRLEAQGVTLEQVLEFYDANYRERYPYGQGEHATFARACAILGIPITGAMELVSIEKGDA
jgi:hypothetical protein